MLNLTEYAKKPKLLADYLPWGFLVGPGIVLNKDGSFLRLAHYRGPDLESATEAAGLTQTELANRLGEYQSFVARLESGQRRVDVVEFIELSSVLGFDAKKEIGHLLAIKVKS